MFLNMSFIDRIIIILWLELKLNSFYVFRWRCGFKIEEWNGKEPNLVIKGATKVFDFKNHKIKLTEIIIKSPLWRIVNKKTIDFIIHITKIFNLIPMLYWNIFELSFGSKFDILRSTQGFVNNSYVYGLLLKGIKNHDMSML